MPRWIVLAAAVLFAGSWACSDNGISNPRADTAVDVAADSDVSDETTEDVAEEPEADVTVDVAVEVDADVDDDEIRFAGPCENEWHCDEGWFCANETCTRLPRCGGQTAWPTCVEAIEAIEPGLGYRGACIDHRCDVLCELDQDCEEGQICTDYGNCLSFDGALTGQHPGGEARAELQAGFGEVLLGFPVGTPLAGYGSRAAFDEGRYAVSLQPSTGLHHALYVRALLIDNGERQVMIIRAPTIFPSMALHEQIARALQEQTGRDWRDSLILSSTHTHSGPARFWHVPFDAALALGAFGIGEFSQELYDLHLASFIAAAEAALDDLSPAQLGWEIVEGFDTDDHVGRDRWGETPPFDDNRVLLLRVDDAEGVPRAVLFSFGAHGTDNGESYASGDVLYGAERELEMALGERYGRFVPTMFVNQNSGSMSPGGGAAGHQFPQTIERFGTRFVEKVFDTLVALETSADIALDASTYRFPISFDLLGYDDDFQSPVPTLPIGGTYRYGGIECTGGPKWGDADYSTYGDENLACIALHFLLHNRPPSIFMRSQITTLDLDGLTVVTMPGELSMELSWMVLRALRDQYEVDPLEAWTWGYSQDHLLYLMPTDLRGELPPFPGISTPMAPDDYPEYALSYLQGGYESGLSPWGPKLGDYLVERAAEAYGHMADPERERTFLEAFPSMYTNREQAPFPVDQDDPEAVGTVLAQPPATVTRLETIEFVWVGGDPGAEQPQAPLVALERQADGGGFEEIELPNFRRYDNRELRFMTRVREGDEGYEWVARWEELKDFPAGTYRFRVDGHYQGETGRTPYTVTSTAFELMPTEAVVVTAVGSAETVCGTLGYPASVRMRFLESIDDPGEVVGHYRMRHYRVPTGVSDPVEAGSDVSVEGLTLQVVSGESEVATEADAQAQVTTADEHVAGRNGVPVTRYCFDLDTTLVTGDYSATVGVLDAYGNRGSTTVGFVVP